eukprot:933434-Pelagomonas_calceolata.AAC.4
MLDSEWSPNKEKGARRIKDGTRPNDLRPINHMQMSKVLGLLFTGALLHDAAQHSFFIHKTY